MAGQLDRAGGRAVHAGAVGRAGARAHARRERWAIALLLGGAATLLLEPVRSTLDYGQVNLLLMVLVVVDLRQSRPRLRGLAIGLAAAVKLTPIVFLLYFVVRRDWRSAAQGVASFSALTLAAWAVLPGDSTLYWLHEATDAARTGAVGFVSNQSFNGMLHRPPFAHGGSELVPWTVLSLGALVLGALVTRRLAMERRPLVEPVLVLAIVELLVSPVSWSHHWAWLGVGPLAAWSLWRDRRWVAVGVAAAVVVGVVAPYWWGVTWPVVGFVADNSLVLAGVGVLSLWGLWLLAPGEPRPAAPPTAAGLPAHAPPGIR